MKERLLSYLRAIVRFTNAMDEGGSGYLIDQQEALWAQMRRLNERIEALEGRPARE